MPNIEYMTSIYRFKYASFYIYVPLNDFNTYDYGIIQLQFQQTPH